MYSAVPNFLLISSMTGGFTTFCGTCAPGHFNFNSFQVADDVDLIRGRHQFAFGFNLIRIQNNTISGFDENGAPTFNGSFTGLGLADFMIGNMSDFQQTNATPDDLRQWVMSVYAQDSFKVSPSFTFNFGLRWEPTFADPDKYGRGTSFSLPAFLAGQVSTVHPTAPAGLFFPGDPGIPAANWNGHYGEFRAARRPGLESARRRQATRLRAGGAILYDSTETWFNERETTNPPFGNDIDVGSTGTLTNPWAGYAGGNPFPAARKSFLPEIRHVHQHADQSQAYLRGAMERHLSAAVRGQLAGFGQLPGQQDHPSLDRRGSGPGGVSGYRLLHYRRRELFDLFHDIQYQSTPPSVPDESGRRHLLRQHRYHGRRRGGALRGTAAIAVSTASAQSSQFNANFTDSYCLSDYDFGAALAGSTNSQLFNRHADWGPCISDTRYNFNLSGVVVSAFQPEQLVREPPGEQLAACAADSRFQRPTVEHHIGQGQFAYRPGQRPSQSSAGDIQPRSTPLAPRS